MREASARSDLLSRLPRGAEVLIIRLRSLGDMVMLTPALALLKGWRPDLALTVLAEPAFAPILEGNPHVAEIIPSRGFARTAPLLRRRRYPVTFNQHGGPTSAWLTMAAGSPVRVCWTGSQFSFAYNLLVPRAGVFFGGRPFHTIQDRLTQFWWTGLPETADIPAPSVYPRPAAREAVGVLLAEMGLEPGAPYAVIHPAAKPGTKVWPMERFAAVARRLGEERGLPAILLLGPGDAAFEKEARRHREWERTLLTGLPLGELLALLAGAALFVGNDSGPAHVAAAAGAPPVVIFGPSNPVRWHPWRVPHRVVRHPFSCHPCFHPRCYPFRETRCTQSVTVDEVVGACGSLLDETARAGGKGK